MIAPSLALLDYHLDLRQELRGRPAGRLLDLLAAAAPPVGRTGSS
jgi:hypothetical protein